MSRCYQCPRRCGKDRENGEVGACGVSADFVVAKTMLHRFEEPCICGENGAGTVFFSGCNLKCVYCQNRDISHGGKGNILTDSELERTMLSLIEQGASCLELVTPSHYTEQIVPLLERIKPKISVPVVWNSNAYERVESLCRLDGLVDVYLPDFKYFSPELADRYSSAPDYPPVALAAISEMVRQVGAPAFYGDADKNESSAMIKSGVIVRHLVLPASRADSIAALRLLAENIGTENMLLSLMSQYTPDFYIEHERTCGACEKNKPLRRKITSFEYDSVTKVAEELGFDGYFQGASSADTVYTPEF